MANFIEVTARGWEFLINLNSIECVKKDPTGKAKITFLKNEEYIVTDEDYSRLKLQIISNNI